MADDQRLYRSNETPARAGQGGAQSSPSGTDPLAELARLIGQSDPFGEFGRESARRHAAPQVQPEPAQPEPAAEWARQPANPAYASQAYAAEPPMAAAGAEQRYAEHYETDAHDAAYVAAPGEQDHEAFYPANPPYAGEQQDFYDDVPPPRRRLGVMAIAAVFALAVVGTAGAFGYRTIFGSSGLSGPPPVIKADATPSKIMASGPAKDSSNKLITDRVNDRAQSEKLVSREEKPVDVNDRPTGMILPPSQATQPGAAPKAPTGNGILASEPKKVRTLTIRPDGTAVADAGPAQAQAEPLATMAAPPPQEASPPPQRAASPPPQQRVASPQPAPEPEAPRPVAAKPIPVTQHTVSARAPSGNAPLSLNPNAPAPHAAAPMRTASVAPTQLAAPAATAARGGGFAVQVSSQRSEAEAQAAFRSLQGKYPAQLGNRHVLIHKIELGAKGTYYRAMVGPFANGSEATQLCSSLKAAGGQCIIQRN